MDAKTKQWWSDVETPTSHNEFIEIRLILQTALVDIGWCKRLLRDTIATHLCDEVMPANTNRHRNTPLIFLVFFRIAGLGQRGTGGWTDRWMDRETDGRTDRQTGRCLTTTVEGNTVRRGPFHWGLNFSFHTLLSPEHKARRRGAAASRPHFTPRSDADGCAPKGILGVAVTGGGGLESADLPPDHQLLVRY